MSVQNESATPFWLDIDGGRLWRDQQPIPLTPKAFDMLRYLAEHPDRLLRHQDLLDAVWPTVFVSEDTIRHYIRELRQALGDDVRNPRYITTVHGRGYRFSGPLTTLRPSVAPAPWLPSGNEPLSLPEQPSVAVLPFINLSNDPDQDYLCEGLSDDIITDLCALRELFVIARHSSFAYKNQTIDIRRIGRELGVRYILEGSVRKLGEQIRINAQLIDTGNGEHLWAQRYDCLLAEIFSVQDDIRTDIVTALEVKLVEGERTIAWRQTTTNPKAYELFQRARKIWYRSFSMEDCQQAKRLCEQALLLDPDFCAALYMLAAMCEWLAAYSETPEIFIQTGIDCARRALAINSSFGDIYMILSILYFRQDKFDLAFRAAEQAVKISPNHPNNLVIFANCLADDGRAEEALTLMQKALRLNPLPPAWYFSDLGYIYLCAHQYAAAIAALQECLRCKPDHIKAHRYLTMVYAEAGRKDEARAQAREVLKLNPHFSITKHLSWWLQLAKTPEEREQRRQRLLDAGLLP